MSSALVSLLLVLQIAFEGRHLYAKASTCTGTSCGVPEFLSSTYINVAASSSGATCTASGVAYSLAIDGKAGSTDNDWSQSGGVGNYIKITFLKTFPVDTIRIKQRGNTQEQSKEIQLDFSGGESTKLTLKRNTGTVWTADSIWEVLHFSEVKAKWVNIKILSVYSAINNGFREIEFYKRDALKGKICDQINLLKGTNSRVENKLFGRTASMVVKSAGLKIFLREFLTNKRYLFDLGTATCTLKKGEPYSDLKTVSCSGLLSSAGFRPLWIDFRCSNIILGSGNEIILQYTDSSPLDVNSIFFAAKEDSEITLCNREDRCFNDAAHYWPLDRVTGGRILDHNGDKSFLTNLTNDHFQTAMLAYQLYTRAAFIKLNEIGNVPYITLGDFKGEAIIDPDVGDFTISFWMMIPTTTNKCKILYSTGVSTLRRLVFKFESGVFRVILRTRKVLFKNIQLPVTKGKHYRIALAWSKKKNTPYLTVNGYLQKMTRVADSPADDPKEYSLKLGDGGDFVISNIILWKRELSVEELENKFACTETHRAEVSCSASNIKYDSSTTEPQCLGVAGCYKGGECYKPDPSGSQATIPVFATASSFLDTGSSPLNARIIFEDVPSTGLTTGWMPDVHDANSYLQFDAFQITSIGHIVVQGSGSDYVKTFEVSHSKSCAVFTYIMDGSSKKVFTGNTDGTSMVTVDLPSTINARCVRIVPKTFNGHIKLRAKLLGTIGPTNRLGCYKDDSFVPTEGYDSSSLTPAKCIVACAKAKKTHAALTSGRYCYCGSSASEAKKTGSANCNFPCSGNPRIKCGGKEAFNVYTITSSFASSLSCNFPSNVTSLSTFSGTCTANSGIKCDFGEPLPVSAENAPLNFMYHTSPAYFRVFCEGSVEEDDVRNERHLSAGISVYDDFEVQLVCPKYVAKSTLTHCLLKVLKGTGISLGYQLTGEASATEVDLYDSIGLGFGEVFDAENTSPDPVKDTTVLLLNTIAPGEGRFLGVDVFIEAAGCMSMQIVRPICGSGPESVYQYSNGNIVKQQTSCSSLSSSCTNGEIFSSDFGLCTMNESLALNTNFSFKLEVVAVNTVCFTSTGRQKLYFNNINITHFKTGDLFALYFPSSSPLKVSSREVPSSESTKTPSVLTISQSNSGVGTILTPSQGTISFMQYSISLQSKITSTVKIPLNFSETGQFTESLNVKSTVRNEKVSANIDVQEKIEGLTLTYIAGAIVNEEYSFTVTVKKGSNLTVLVRFDSTSSHNASLKSTSTFVHTYSKRQRETISVTVWNDVDLVYKECKIWVQEKVNGLEFREAIGPITYPNKTLICFRLTDGDSVTITADYGNSNSSKRGEFNIKDKYIGCFSHNHLVGVYEVFINATNDASSQSISQIVIVEKEILQLSCNFAQEFAHEHIEVNETIYFDCAITQGTGAKYQVSWGDGITEIYTANNPRLSHSYLNYQFYDINITVFNNVSRMNFSQNIQVHKPVYPLKNFNIACRATNFTDPSACIMTIDGGNDFNCTWDFDDGLTSFSNDSHVGKQFNHTYANIGYYDINVHCVNRLYNTTIGALAIVEIPMKDLRIGELPACPLEQSASVYVAVETGSGVDFKINKTNLHTGSTMELSPVFNAEHTNGTVTFPCDVVGTYFLEATAVNNVTILQSFRRDFEIDQTIGGISVVRQTEEYVVVGNTSAFKVTMSQGSNVTCYFDYKDGITTTRFLEGFFPAAGEVFTHAYKDAIDAVVEVICNNSVSQEMFSFLVKAQHPNKEVFLVCSDPQHFPPGKVKCTFDKPNNIPYPTNSTCKLDFGDSVQETINFDKKSIVPHTYLKPGWYPVNAKCANDISMVTFLTSAQVETPIDADIINFTTSGGLYGVRGQGRGVDHSYFPCNNTIDIDVDWGNGTNVTLKVEWNDATPRTEIQKNSSSHIYTHPGLYRPVVTLSNAVGFIVKTFVIRIQDAVAGFTFTNNGPIALDKPFVFVTNIEKVGTSTCLALDIGNGTSFLYKPSVDIHCAPDCSYGKTQKTYSTFPFIFSHVHKYIGNYEIHATACNNVSTIELKALANVSPKPCKYPEVNFTSFEANTTAQFAIQYRRSIQIPITPVIKIDCEATKFSRREWDINKCDEDGNPESCKPLTSNCSKEIVMTNPSLLINRRCLTYGIHRLSALVEMLGGGTKGIFVKSYAWINITKTPLTAAIVGGSSKAVGYNRPLTIDGTISIDPDTGDSSGIKIYWFCHEKSEHMPLDANSSTTEGMPATTNPVLKTALNQSNARIPYNGCFGYGPGRINLTDGKITILTDGMKIDGHYEFVLKIKKDDRWASTSLSMLIVAGTPPDCSITCIVGCGKKVNPSDKHGVQVYCSCPECGTITYKWRIFKQNKTTQEMVEIPNPENMASTPLTFNNLVIKPNALQGGEIYDFKINAFDTKNRVMGYSGRKVLTNQAPRDGFCEVNPKIGNSDTKFNFSCPNWVDDDEYITFSINYYDPVKNRLTPIYKMRSDTATSYVTTLRVGDEGRDFNNSLRVLICDPLLSCDTANFEVQVTLKKKDEKEFQTFLKDLADIEGRIPLLSGEGRIDELCAYIYMEISNLKKLQETRPKWSETTMNLIVKAAEFCMDSTCEIVSADPKKAACKASVISLILSVNATLTKHTQDVSVDCLMEAATDINSFPPAELQNAAGGMVEALGSSLSVLAVSNNATNSAVKSPEDTKKNKEEQKKQSASLMDTFSKIGAAVQSQLVSGEQNTIATDKVTMTSTKTTAEGLKKVTSQGGGGVGGLTNAVDPNSKESFGVGLVETADNPFGWADGANDVNSPILDLGLSGEDGSEKPIQNLTEPISVMISQPGKKIAETHHKLDPSGGNNHMLEVPKNHSSIHIEFFPSNKNISYIVFLRRNKRPTPEVHDYNHTYNFTLNNTDDISPNMWFLSNEELNKTAAATWKIKVTVAKSDADVEGEVSYNISIYTAACMFFNKTTQSFSSAGMKVGPRTTRDVTECLSTHATSFASDFFVPPNKIDWDKISLDELLNNPIVFIVVMVIFGLYFLLLIWARRADKKDLDKIGLTPLPDNDPRDTYLYEIVVYTGHASNAGTTSDVYIILSGGLDETSPKKLRDPDPARKKFCKGSVDYFLLAVPRSLGKLRQLHIWHDNKGSDPSWFLQRIMVRDLQADKKTWFVNLRWLAVEEDDGMIERTLTPATKEELTNFGLLFSTEARKNLTDNHLWFSVVARPPKSTFTRVQRLSCCLSVILTTMLANAMFYQVGDESSTGTSIHVGPFSFSIKQISIGITSSLVVLPVNVIVVTIFRKIKPPDPKAKEDKQRDPNKNDEKYKVDEEKPQIVVKDEEDVGSEKEDSEADVEEEEAEEEEKEKENDKKKKKKEKKKKKTATLSPKFAYLAYTLIFLASTVSATFTVFYGLTFGKEKSEGWISSMMISFWQDVLISQPLKVFAAAMFFALVIKDPNKNEDDEQQNELNPDEELVHQNVQNNEEEKTLRKMGFVAKPPDPEKLETFRQLRLKQKQMKSILYEIVQYFFFLVLVLIIAYGNRDPMAYGVTRAMDGFFVQSDYTEMGSFDGHDRPSKYWTWVLNTYIATLKPYYWYGPMETVKESDVEYKTSDDDEQVLYMKGRENSSGWVNTNGNYIKNATVLHTYPDGFVADHATAYLVGSPRIRQLRILKNQSKMLPFVSRMFNESNSDYDWDLEDKESYHHYWKPFGVNDTKDEESKSPWYYRSAWELKGTPYWGFFASYWGGGYVADLGSDRLEAETLTKNLSASGWIDKYSRALFAEFTVYNPYTNFFSAVTLLTEIRATGGYFHSPRVQTIRLYRYIGPEMAFVMACEISYIAFLVYFLYKQVKKYRADRREYFQDGWNYLEIALLSFSISSVGLYFARMGITTLTIKNMKESQNQFVSFQYVAFLDEWVSATCSLAVFFSFLKFLRLLRFNRRMAMLSLTLKRASKPLFYFFVYFAIIFLAYVQFGFSIFGVSDPNYASFHRSIVSVFSMTLGSFDFHALNQANRIFGPMYFFTYVVLIIFILMNVFLSILMDHFDEVNQDVLQQGNDHEMLAFMVHAVKSNMGKKCGPAIKPTYIDEKSGLEKAVESVDDISDNIQYAFRNICLEDIRQTKWFDPRKTTTKKNLVIHMLLEDEENFTENDLCDAIPVLDEFIASHSIEEIVRCLVAYREKRRHEEMVEESKAESESCGESDEEETESSADEEESEYGYVSANNSKRGSFN